MYCHISYASPSKSQLYAIFVIVVIILFGAPWSRAQNPASPQAAVKNPLWNFGYLPQKAAAGADFYIYNHGSAPLTVLKIESGCSCTSISKIDHPLQPGDSAVVTVTFKTGRYRGNVKKTTKVYTDDPDNEILKLTISAYVLKRGEESEKITVTPTILDWKLENDRLVFEDSVLNVLNKTMDTVSIGILNWPENILEKIELTSGLAPGESLNLPFKFVSKTRVPPENTALSVTLGFTGSDTTILTVPVKIK